MVSKHSNQLLRTRWKFLGSVPVFWTCNIMSHTQVTCSCQCGFLISGVLHMRHQPMCTNDLGCLLPWSFYHLLYVLGISILASILPCTTWCFLSLYCTGRIQKSQCWSLHFFLTKVVLQLQSLEPPHLSFLVL